MEDHVHCVAPCVALALNFITESPGLICSVHSDSCLLRLKGLTYAETLEPEFNSSALQMLNEIQVGDCGFATLAMTHDLTVCTRYVKGPGHGLQGKRSSAKSGYYRFSCLVH